jgi:acetyl esterase/lipase
MDSEKYSQFNITTTPYKVVNNQEIPLYVLLPKGVHTGKRPVLVHLHGGFLFAGDALYPDWSTQWSRDYSLHHSAIRISANYRLAPESNGLEILSDIRDLWTWIQNDLSEYLKRIGSDITPDFDKVMVYGESAGGYLAIQSGLMRPDLLKAVIASYPMTYIDSPWYAVASEDRHPFGIPQISKEEVLDKYIAGIEKGKIVTSSDPYARLPLAIVTLQNGLFPEILGKEDEIYPARVLEKMTGKEKIPFLFVMHGTEDTAVPCEESKKFVSAWEGKFGKGSVLGKFESGEHGFDGSASLETPWMKEGLAGVTKAWIG